MKKFGVAKISAVLLILVGLAFGGWYYFSPYYGLMGLKNALEAGDATKLAAHIDFAALRNNLKQQLSARLAAQLAKELPADNAPQAEGALPPAMQREMMQAAHAMAAPMMNAMLDAMLTPQGFAKLIQNNQPPQQDGAPKTAFELLEDVTIEREAFSSFSVRIGQTKEDVALIFERDGLGWKLVNIKL
jgi:Protein of unknown function (DUF2939)